MYFCPSWLCFVKPQDASLCFLVSLCLLPWWLTVRSRGNREGREKRDAVFVTCWLESLQCDLDPGKAGATFMGGFCGVRQGLAVLFPTRKSPGFASGSGVQTRAAGSRKQPPRNPPRRGMGIKKVSQRPRRCHKQASLRGACLAFWRLATFGVTALRVPGRPPRRCVPRCWTSVRARVSFLHPLHRVRRP